MANKKISELSAAGALTGTELIEAVQGGVNVKTTTQDIANLGGGGSGTVESVTGDGVDNTDPDNPVLSFPELSDLPTVEAALNDKSDAGATIVTDTGAYTLQASDLTLINAGATLIIDGDSTDDLTVPLNSSVAFPVGSFIGVRDYNNVVATGGVTITGTSGSLAIPSGMTATLEKTGTDTWILHNGGADAIGAATQTALDAKLAHTNSAVALTDGASITLTATKHTLTTDESAITFSISYAGDDITIEATVGVTTATYTFPAGSLCVSEGIETGGNTLAINGAVDDVYIIAIKKIGSVYYVVSKNFGQ